MTENQPKPRGFAAISPERRREIASQGGRAAHAKGTAHTWNTETATAAGRKGGDTRAQRIAQQQAQNAQIVQQNSEVQT